MDGVFYREYAAAMREPDALQTAAGIMLSYYRIVESTAQDSPCIEDVRLVRALERNGFRESADAREKPRSTMRMSFLNKELPCIRKRFPIRKRSLR